MKPNFFMKLYPCLHSWYSVSPLFTNSGPHWTSVRMQLRKRPPDGIEKSWNANVWLRGIFSEIYLFESSLYDICLAFSLTECQTFIVNGWFGESGTIIYNIITRWHHLLVVVCSKQIDQIYLKCQLYIYIYIYTYIWWL